MAKINPSVIRTLAVSLYIGEVGVVAVGEL